MFDMEDKENESQQENGKPGKLVAEPSGQKPRRSVLKEFDPFAPDSPCPPKLQVKNTDVHIIDEEEVFVDAETSLTSYVCPRNKNIDNSPEKIKTPHKVTNGTRESLLIPDLRDNYQEELINPNDITDMSYVEAVENLSQVNDVFLMDKTSSEEDFEFNIKKPVNNPKIIIEDSENKLLDITMGIEKPNNVNEDNVMVDSLETFEKTLPTGDQEKSESITNQTSENAEVPQVKENGVEGPGSMIDSLELPDSKNAPIADDNSEKHQEVLIDSLEALKVEGNIEVSNFTETSSSGVPKVKNTGPDDLNGDNVTASKHNANLNNTFDTQTTNTASENVESQKSAVLDTTFETSTSNDNTELNNTFEAPSSDAIESKTEQSQTDQVADSNTTVELSKTLEAIALDTVGSKIDQFQGNQIDTAIGDGVELNKTFEAPTSNTADSTTDQHQIDRNNTPNDNDVELDKTFEAPLSSMPETKDKPEEVLDQNSLHIEVVTDNEVLDKDVDENKPLLEENSNAVICLNKDETCPKQTESDIQQKYDDAESKPRDTPLNETDAISDSLENKVISTGSNIAQSCEEETVKPQQSPPHSNIGETQITDDHFVSLKDITDVDQDKNQADNMEPTGSKRLSFVVSGSEDVNSTFVAEEHAAESSRVMEALAQSLNQTIDVEESAIVDDLNSSKSANSSNDSSKERLNVTIGNIKDDNRPDSTTEDKEPVKHEEPMEKQKSNKILERQEIDEFEDLEKQCNDKVQSTEVQEAVDGIEMVIKKFDEQNVETVEENYSKVYHRQDTQEFEALERQYNENAQNGEVTEENINSGKNTEAEKESKIVKRQETKEFEDLERECKENEQLPIESSEPTKLNAESIQNSKVVIAEKNVNKNEIAEKEPVAVKVKVSGNVCNANSVIGECKQTETEGAPEQHLGGIKLKYDLQNKEKVCCSNPEQKTTNKNAVEVNNQTLKKTEKILNEEVPKRMVIANDEAPRKSESIARAKTRPECRPSTRSVRNKTQVIDKPIVIGSDTTKELKQDKDINNSSLVANEYAEKQLQEYKTRSDDLKTQVDKLQTEIEAIKNENMKKDKYILTCALNIEGERDNIIKLKKLLTEYEQTISRQNEDLRKLKEGEEKTTKSFTSLEMAFADVFEKYEKTKSVIEAYKKNEEILQRNIQCAEDQLTKLEAKCSVMREQYTENLKTVEEQMSQEKEKYKQDIGKLQAMVKRLEIKSSSLETALKQKTEECRALAALCDDITGNPM